MVEACWGIETYSHIAYTCIHMHTLDRWVWLTVYLQSYVGSLRCSVLLLASSDGYKANENKPGLLSPKTPLSTRSMNLSSWNIAVDKGSYTLYAHTHRHTQIQDCASHLDFMVTMKKIHQVQFCCNRSCQRSRLEGTRATRCDIVKQFEDFEADLNNRSQEIAHVSVLSLLYPFIIFHPWDTGFIWLLCRPKVSKGGFTSRVVGFHRGSSKTHFRKPYAHQLPIHRLEFESLRLISTNCIFVIFPLVTVRKRLELDGIKSY